MTKLLIFYAVGNLGIVLHIAKRVRGQRLTSLWNYIGSHSLSIFISWLTYTLVYVGWVEQPELAASLGFAYAPGVLAAIILAFVSDSILSFQIDRTMSKIQEPINNEET